MALRLLAEHSLEVDVANRRYRVTLQDGEAINVAVWVLEEFGLRAPLAYWRPVWRQQRTPGRLMRAAIAEAMAAATKSLTAD